MINLVRNTLFDVRYEHSAAAHGG